MSYNLLDKKDLEKFKKKEKDRVKFEFAGAEYLNIKDKEVDQSNHGGPI